MGNPKKIQELIFKLLKDQDPTKYYKYDKQPKLVAEELFDEKVCRKTCNSEGNEVPLLDKHGNPEYYQLQSILDLEIQTGTITEEEQKFNSPHLLHAYTNIKAIFRKVVYQEW